MLIILTLNQMYFNCSLSEHFLFALYFVTILNFKYVYLRKYKKHSEVKKNDTARSC
jgi:hypothetical protein